MKKFLAFALSALALTSVAFAEGSEEDSETQSVTAFVEVPIDVVSIRSMDLGTLERGDEGCVAEGQTAQFRVFADEGDNIWVEVNGGDPIVLHALHGQVDAQGNPTTLGPDQYDNDQNGHADQPSSMITIVPSLRYRFVNDDEAHALPWDLPTWVANDTYCDTQDDNITRCIGVGSLGCCAMGQINVYVGGCYTISDYQQRGLYEGEVTLRAFYD
jgi:hypothetical protein